MSQEKPRFRALLWPILISGLVLFLAGCGWTGWRWYALYQAFYDTSVPTFSTTAPSTPTPKKPVPAVVIGLSPAPNQVSSLSQLFLSPYFNDGIQEVLPDDILIQSELFLPNLATTSELEKRLIERISAGLASIPTADPSRRDYDISRPSPDYREVRNASRFWYVIGRLSGDSGHSWEAVQIMLGIAFLARTVEPLCLTDNALVSRMIVSSIRKTAARGLVAVSPVVRLSVDQVRDVLKHVATLEQGLEFGDILEAEVQALVEIGRYMLRRAETGDAFAMRKRPLGAVLADERRVAAFNSTMFHPLAEAARLPFAQGSPRFTSQAQLIESTLQEISEKKFSRIFRYLFSPEDFFFNEILYQNIPISTQALGVDTESRQFFRGAGVAVAVQACKTMRNRWPESLDEVASWVGHPLQTDLFSGQPLIYTASPPRLISVGKDLTAGTSDDIVYIPATKDWSGK